MFLDTEDYERFGVFGKGAQLDRGKRALEVCSALFVYGAARDGNDGCKSKK